MPYEAATTQRWPSQIGATCQGPMVSASHEGAELAAGGDRPCHVTPTDGLLLTDTICLRPDARCNTDIPRTSRRVAFGTIVWPSCSA